MRGLLILGYVALALGAGILAAFAAPADAAPGPGFDLASVSQVGEANQRAALMKQLRDVAAASGGERSGEAGSQSLVETVGTIIGLAGAGVVGTFAAVGLRRVWFQNPIRDPYGEGSGFL